MSAQEQISECAPPRRGAVIALTVDSTARAYDLVALALGGFTPKESQRDSSKVVLWMQAETADVYFYFASGEVGAVATTDVDDVSDTAKIGAGNAIAFDNAYCAVLKTACVPMAVRIDRGLDRFLVVKAASTSGVLRFWAASAGF